MMRPGDWVQVIGNDTPLYVRDVQPLVVYVLREGELLSAEGMRVPRTLVRRMSP